MSIQKIHVGNFKGIDKGQWIDIKPITVFIGANSSGKSSCLHALACLSQTVKLPNNIRPLILDDEFANVHLGRFIEVIHSKSYQDTIDLGLAFDDVKIVNFENTKSSKSKREKVKGVAFYKFKCSRRTQEVSLDFAKLDIHDKSFIIKREGKSYKVTKGKFKTTVELDSAFFFSQVTAFKIKRSLDEYLELIDLIQFQEHISKELTRTCYIGPFRQSPQRKYPTRSASPTEVGPMGESTVTLLANEIVQKRSRTHITQIEKWLNQLGLAKTVDVTRLGRSDLFDVSMTTTSDGETFPLADLGYGLSQVIPVLTQCSFASSGSTLLFEQPEIHLHSIAARGLASIFTETAKLKPCNIIIETHSPELVKQLFLEVNTSRLSPDDFVIYRVTRKDSHSVIEPIDIEIVDGEVDVYTNWESGISIP